MVELFKKHGFVVVVAIILIAFSIYFVWEDNSGKVPSKSVNGEDIVFSIGDLNVSANTFYDQLKSDLGNSGMYNFLYRSVVNQVYETTEDMETEAKNYADSIISSYYSYYGAEYETYLLEAIHSVGYSTVEDLVDYYLEQIKLEQFLSDYVMADTDGVLTNYLEEAKPRIVSHILVKIADFENITEEEQAKIDAVEEALAANTDFATIATEHSDDTSAEAGGLLGFMDANTSFVAEFLEAALALEEGQMTEWVKTEYGYHIILCDSTNLDVLTDETNKSSFMDGIVAYDTYLIPRSLWEKAETLGVTFASEEDKANFIKFLGLESDGE